MTSTRTFGRASARLFRVALASVFRMTPTPTLTHIAPIERIDKQEQKQACASDIEIGWSLMATMVHGFKMGGEPLCRKQIVNTQSKGHGSANDGSQVQDEGASAHNLLNNQYGSGIDGRPCHQQYKSRTWRQTLHHQSNSNGDRPRRTQIHRHSKGQHQQDTEQCTVCKQSKKGVRDYDPGASEVNQLNRIKLMLSTAHKNLA